jgi:hypothetical protein
VKWWLNVKYGTVSVAGGLVKMDSESSDILYHTPTNFIIVPTNSHHHSYTEGGTSRERKHREHGHCRGAEEHFMGSMTAYSFVLVSHPGMSMQQGAAAVQCAGAAQAEQCCARVAGALQRLVAAQYTADAALIGLLCCLSAWLTGYAA